MRIIIKCPESDSPPKGRIHLRGLSFRPTSNLLQFDGGPYISPTGAPKKEQRGETVKEAKCGVSAGEEQKLNEAQTSCERKPGRPGAEWGGPAGDRGGLLAPD